MTLNEGLSTGEYVATCNIYPQARGTISAQVWDYAENNCISKEELTIVVDSEAPTRMVSYIPNKVLDEETFESKNIEDYQEGYKWVLYYKEPAVVTFEIEEANFDLSLMRDAAPVIKIKNILTDEVVDAKVNWTKIKDDENKPDTYIATYTIEDDGDYVVTMTYQDLSTNLMSAYQSSKIVIDRQIPVISTRYEDGKFYQVQDGVKFYPNNQHLVIEVEEHNFLADDFVLTVSAKDIQGNDVNVDKDSFLDFAQDRANWTLKEKNDEKKENVYVLDMSAMEFSTDAVYTVDIVYDDILDNKAEDYPTDHFVIDHEGPTNLQIWYSDALNTETVAPNEYGFYQEPLTVTVSADDITAGVDYFKWVYTVQKGASRITWRLSRAVSKPRILTTATRE